MAKLGVIGLVVCLLVFLASAAALVTLRSARNAPSSPNVAASDPAVPSPAAENLKLPAFQLTTQAGAPFTNQDLKGKVTIVDFIFTHCPFICPTLLDRMSDLSRRLNGTGVRFLSISVDPEHDTPEVLAAYALKNNLDTKRWTLGVGTKETTTAIVRDGLKFSIEDDPQAPIKLPSGKTMNNIVHPSWFLLIGPDARVLGVYMSSNPDDMSALEARARELDRRLKR